MFYHRAYGTRVQKDPSCSTPPHKSLGRRAPASLVATAPRRRRGTSNTGRFSPPPHWGPGRASASPALASLPALARQRSVSTTNVTEHRLSPALQPAAPAKQPPAPRHATACARHATGRARDRQTGEPARRAFRMMIAYRWPTSGRAWAAGGVAAAPRLARCCTFSPGPRDLCAGLGLTRLGRCAGRPDGGAAFRSRAWQRRPVHSVTADAGRPAVAHRFGRDTGRFSSRRSSSVGLGERPGYDACAGPGTNAGRPDARARGGARMC